MEIEEQLPEKFELYQNYPNPFNPRTTIKFAIPASVKNEMLNTKLVVFDILGREVATLVNENLKPGNYEVKFNASGLPSGTYFYRIELNEKFRSVKKMLFLK
ncbi:MAG: T9SS type A sorting domain-containing protein [Melioribacteraceae bacterium]|nr:T9SS type A sorting domain-containing protein [Melioribacteraceae bacterium]